MSCSSNERVCILASNAGTGFILLKDMDNILPQLPISLGYNADAGEDVLEKTELRLPDLPSGKFSRFMVRRQSQSAAHTITGSVASSLASRLVHGTRIMLSRSTCRVPRWSCLCQLEECDEDSTNAAVKAMGKNGLSVGKKARLSQYDSPFVVHTRHVSTAAALFRLKRF